MNLNTHTWQPLGAEQLVQLGKSAAKTAEVSGMSLTDAVVRTIGMTKLNSEQVRRVVESANHEAFHQKYAAMNASMRVVDVEGGPADASAVQERLSLLGEPAKTASYRNDYALGPQYPVRSDSYVEPMTKQAALEPVIDLQGRLQATHEELTGHMSAKKADVEQSIHKITHHVRQALSEGAYHEDIERAWGHFNPKFATELASSFSLPRAPAGVKTASRSVPLDHPLVTSFTHFVKVANEYEAACEAVRDVERELVRVDTFMRSQG